jgi:acid stress-induced BolA-like protein IbaG/YrbA
MWGEEKLVNKLMKEIEDTVLHHLPGAVVKVSGDGYHFEAIVVASQFAGLAKVKRQQLVYQALNEMITTGKIHALNIKAFDPTEWEKA